MANITKDLKELMSQSSGRVKAMSFHPTKPVLLVGHHNGIISAWDYQMGHKIYEFIDHDGSVRSLVFHPRGDFFISGGDDKIIRVWSYTEKRITNKLKGHTDFIRSLDFHPTKPWILSASDDQTIAVWNMSTGKQLGLARGHVHYVMSAKFVGDDMIVSGSLDQSIRVWSCKGLLEVNKKSSFMPDIVIMQIIDGHDRGVNTLSVSSEIIVSGGDDRDIKIWEYNKESLWQKEAMYNHKGSVTSVLIDNNYILSCGEDGLFSIFDMDNRKNEELSIEGRLWCLSKKDNIYAVGHDSGFMVYYYAEPIGVCATDKGFYYIKNGNICFSDYSKDKVIGPCKPKFQYMDVSNDYLLVQYEGHYDLYKNNKLKSEEKGTSVFVLNDSNQEDVNSRIVRKENNSSYIESNKSRRVISIDEGKIFRSHRNNSYFLVHKRNIKFIEIDSKETNTLSAFEPIKIVSSENRVAVIGEKFVSIYNYDLSLLSTTTEISKIVDGAFHNEIFIYATQKHLKYLYEDSGVLKSISKLSIPFIIKEGTIYMVTGDGLESSEIDLSEVEFKKAVMENKDVTNIIESGALPGLAPLYYLIKKEKGSIALPYITDERQRFELYLSDYKLEECLEYCKKEGTNLMFKRLGLAALKKCNVTIAEECFKKIKDWNMLVMLYIASNQIENMRALLNEVDEATKISMMLYLEDKNVLKNIGCTSIKESKENILSNSITSAVNKKVDGAIDNIGAHLGSVLTPGISVEPPTGVNLEKVDAPIESEDVDAPIESEDVDVPIESEDVDVPIESEEFSAPEKRSSDELEWDSDEKNIEKEIQTMDLLDTFPFDKNLLEECLKLIEEGSIEENMEKGLSLTTDGKFSKALQSFKSAIIKIAKEIINSSDANLHLNERTTIGTYITGLLIEKERRHTEDPLKILTMAKYFASLPLEPKHRLLASTTAMVAFKKYGNIKSAKLMASELLENEKSKKAAEKILLIEDNSDKYEIPTGIFCLDVMDMKNEAKTCLLCFSICYEGKHCVGCEIGVLK